MAGKAAVRSSSRRRVLIGAAAVLGVVALIGLRQWAHRASIARTLMVIPCAELRSAERGQLVSMSATVTPAGVVRCDGLELTVRWRSVPYTSRQQPRTLWVSGIRDEQPSGEPVIADATGEDDPPSQAH